MVCQHTNTSEDLVTWQDELIHAIRVLHAINHQVRLRLIRLMLEEPMASVKRLQKRLHLGQAVCSQHLAVLRRVDLVIAHRKGQRVLYVVNYQKLQVLMTGAKALP